MNGCTNGVENGVKRAQSDIGIRVNHSAAKKAAVNHSATNGTVAENRGSIPGKNDLGFLRNLVDIVIQDGLIGAMDRDT